MGIDPLVSAVRQAAGAEGNTARGNLLVEAADRLASLARLNACKTRWLFEALRESNEHRARIRELEAQLRECQGELADADKAGR